VPKIRRISRRSFHVMTTDNRRRPVAVFTTKESKRGLVIAGEQFASLRHSKFGKTSQAHGRRA